MSLLVYGAKVLSLDPQQPVLDHGAVLIEGDRIVAVGTAEELRRADGIERELGGDSMWVMPGFFNAHYHNWRTFSMGATPDAPLEVFLLQMSQLELPDGDLGNEFSYLNALVSAFQLVRSGVTTTVDMSLASNHRPVIQAYLDLGLDLIYAPTIRTQLGYVYADDAVFLASLPDDLRQQIQGQGLGLTGGYEEPDTYWQTWLDLKTEFGDQIQMVLAPDGPEWCTADELKLWNERADQQATCLHLHNSESPMEMQWALKSLGCTMTEYLANLGFLGPNVSCGHSVWLSDHDVELLADAGASAVHCPSSNLRLSNGIAPVAAYLKSGLNVALGTDGQGLADTSDFLDEMRLAAFLQRTPGLHTQALSAWSMFEMATVNGAAAFMRYQLGRLQPGCEANLVLIDAQQMRSPYLWPGHEPYAAVLQRARSQDVKTVVCRGKVLMQDGHLTTVDEQWAIAKLQALYEHIWEHQSPERAILIDALRPYVTGFFEAWSDLPVAPRYQFNRI